MMNSTKTKLKWGTIITLLAVALIALFMVGIPKYKVWQQGLAGEAELARAKQNRQIKIEEANATVEAAVKLGQADSIRAIYIAKANQIINNSITPEFVAWSFVEAIKEGNSEVIYVPTESNMILMPGMPTFGNAPKRSPGTNTGAGQ